MAEKVFTGECLPWHVKVNEDGTTKSHPMNKPCMSEIIPGRELRSPDKRMQTKAELRTLHRK